MTDRVFLTGGTGFVGSAILERLLAAGRPVSALCRSQRAAERLAELGASPVRGDVTDLEGLRRGIPDGAVVYHVAGVNAFCLRDPAPLFRVNVAGTRNVLTAAADAGASRVVHTSSAAAIGEPRGAVGSEATAHRGSFLSAYERSKHEAEQEAWQVAAQRGLDVVCVNPSSVQGPGRSGGTARMLLAYLNGRLPVVVDSQVSVVDIDDCAEGHLLAEARGRPGRRYVLSGATLTVREGVALLAALTGLDERPRTLPPQLASAAGIAAELLARLRRSDGAFCREQIRTLIHGHAYDGSRATRELGLVYTPVEDTLARTLRWFVGEGLLDRPLPRLPA